MRLDLYIKKNNNSNQYELFDTEYIKYKTSNLNLDNIKLFLIKLFKNKFSNNEYKIKVKSDKIKKDNKKTVVSVFFEYDKYIKRDFRIKKVLQSD